MPPKKHENKEPSEPEDVFQTHHMAEKMTDKSLIMGSLPTFPSFEARGHSDSWGRARIRCPGPAQWHG